MMLRVLKDIRGPTMFAEAGDVIDQPDETVARRWIMTRTAEEVFPPRAGVAAATRRRKAIHRAHETR